MPDQVPEHVKTLRSGELLEIGARHKKEFESWYLGKCVDVLVEEKVIQAGEDLWVGHTKEYVKIAVKDEKMLQNLIVNVEIDNTSQIID